MACRQDSPKTSPPHGSGGEPLACRHKNGAANIRNVGSKTWLVTCAALLVIAACGSGCGRHVPQGMVLARGAVRFDGKPLPAGTIMLEGSPGSGSAAGRVQADGAFELIVRPGEYQVAVRSLESEATYDQDRKLIAGKRRTPERYESIATSGLKITVTPRGDRLSINLEK